MFIHIQSSKKVIINLVIDYEQWVNICYLTCCFKLGSVNETSELKCGGINHCFGPHKICHK